MSTEAIWHPIETAPKDGTYVLITGGAPGYGWDGRRHDFPTPPCVVAAFLEPQWQFAYYDSGFYGIWINPTHWMPVPPPPSAEGE